MKIALATTTIHIPHALKLMRKCSSDVRFFVAGDTRTPPEVAGFENHNYHYSGFECPIPNAWKCSGPIGWNTLARRNIALLEALKWGADVIYSWDNDNLPVGTDHFDCIEGAIGHPFDGIKVDGLNGWFDPGTLLIPSTRHRGFPCVTPRTRHAEPVTDARIGVAAGLVIGDPDIDSTTRIELKPDIGAVHILGQTGVVVDPHTWTVFNSQNTAVIRELIPAWFMGQGLGRHDDIFGSLIVQRVMRDRGYHAHFGQPFTYQERNSHDLLVDLRAEIDGMDNVLKMAGLLDAVKLPMKSVIDDTIIIYEALQHTDWYPKQAVTAAFAWLEDCETVL